MCDSENKEMDIEPFKPFLDIYLIQANEYALSTELF